MPLVPALCTQCGSKLEIDSGNEAGICPHCHTAFVTEKAINNYNTTNVTNIGSLHADVVKINDSNSIDNQVKSGDTFIKLNDYESAKKVFDKLTKECPYDYRGWWGLIKVETKNFENSDISKAVLNYIDELYEKTAAVISEGDKASVEEVYIAYKSMVNSNLSSLEKNASFNAQRLSELLNEHKSSYEKRINELINTEKYVQASAKRKVLYFRIIAIITTLVISAILGVVAAGKTEDFKAAVLVMVLTFGMLLLIIFSLGKIVPFLDPVFYIEAKRDAMLDALKKKKDNNYNEIHKLEDIYEKEMESINEKIDFATARKRSDY